MTTYKNPAVDQGQAIPTSAGRLVINRHKFDFAATAYAPTTLTTSDKIQIGVVPAGCKLVSQLSMIRMIAVDTNGTPTGDYTIGSTDDADALKGSAASETAVNLSGEDFITATADLGAKNADVKIYVTPVANSATVPTSGVIYADLVLRPYNSNVDSDVT